MELHELERAWRALSAQRDELVLERRARRLGGVRWRLRWFSAAQMAQLVIGLGLASWAASTWVERLDRPDLVAAGLVVHAWAVGLIVAAGVQLVLALRLDLVRPVLELQGAVVRLRRTRLRWERALLMGGFLVWGPASLLVLERLGVDLWRINPVAVFVHLTVSLGLAFVVGAMTFRFRAAFERDAARSLAAIEEELADLSRPTDGPAP